MFILSPQESKALKYNDIAVTLQQQEKFEKSLYYFLEASEIWESLGEEFHQAVSLNGAGALYKDLGQYSMARDYLERALVLRRRVQYPSGECLTLLTLGPVYQQLGQVKEAITCLSDARNMAQELQDADLQFQSNYNSGIVYYSLGQYNHALDYFQRSLDINQVKGNLIDRNKCLQSLGNANAALNKYGESMEYYHQSLQLSRRLHLFLSESSVLHNIGLLNIKLGLFDEAIINLERSANIAFKQNAKTVSSNTLSAIGHIYLKCASKTVFTKFIKINNDQDINRCILDALGYFQRALDICHKTGNQEEKAEALSGISNAFILQKKYSDAHDFIKQVLEICTLTGALSLEVDALNTLSLIYIELGELKLAIDCCQEALDISHRNLDKHREVITLYYLAFALIKNKQIRRAYHMLNLAIKIIERNLRFNLFSNDLRIIFFNNLEIQNYYYLLSYCLIELSQGNDKNKINKSFYVCEKRHVWSLFNFFSDQFKQEGVVSSNDLLEEENLMLEIKRLQKEINRPDLSINQRIEFIRQRHELEFRYYLLQENVFSRFYNEIPIENSMILDLQSVKDNLIECPNIALLEYSMHDDNTYLWLVTKDVYELHVLPESGKISEKISNLWNAIIDFNAEVYMDNAYQLYSILLKPIEKSIIGKQLIIVPDYNLNYLPFEALLTEDPRLMENSIKRDFLSKIKYFFSNSSKYNYDQFPYLIKKHSIVYETSSTMLSFLKSKREQYNKEGFLGIAPINFDSNYNFLPNTEDEILSINQIFTNTFTEEHINKLLLKEKATKSDILSNLNTSYGYMHFATHGLADPDRPKFSKLVFPSVSKDEQNIYAYEISRIRVNAKLVVLSACKTGFGKLLHGTGMISLMNSFFSAGAQSVCGSLWNVNDKSTSELMKKFYYNMIVLKKNKSDSLQQAKLKIIQNSKYSFPFYWAPFILSGDWQ